MYGPSAPLMLGKDDSPEQGEGKRLIPLEAWGVRFMSIGLLVNQAEAMIWRGPMAAQALGQLLTDVIWGTAEVRSTCWSSTCRRAPATSS